MCFNRRCYNDTIHALRCLARMPLLPLYTIYNVRDWGTRALISTNTYCQQIQWSVDLLIKFTSPTVVWPALALSNSDRQRHRFLPHYMQCRRGICDENAVGPSVCLSVKRVDCDKTVERSVHIFTPYERSFSLVFWEEEWLVGGDPFYVKCWVNWSPLERNRRFWTDIQP